MKRTENKQKVLSCLIKGPGPIYKLPTLVGYKDHDPSRYRNPAYTLRPQTDIKSYLTPGPGPEYNVRKLTKVGPDKAPAYSISKRRSWKLKEVTPGPGSYYPELCPPMNHRFRAPAYSITSRTIAKFLDKGPSPNAYLLPTCIGPKIPDKYAQGAFSITGYHDIRKEMFGPGPAAYNGTGYNILKYRNPAYSLRGKYILPEKYRSPGPVFYPLYDAGKRSPVYSFGVKHSECAGIPITQLDN